MPTYGFTGTVDDLQFARMQALAGPRVAVETPTAWAPTVTANAREVSVAAGSGWLPGLRHETTGATTIANATNSSGSTRYDLVVWRADWTAKTVTLTAITGTPGAGVPAAITKSMLTTGVVYDLPVVVCRTVSGGGAYTTPDLYDLRPYGAVGHLVVPDGTFLASHDLVPGQRWKVANTGITYVVDSAGALVVDDWIYTAYKTAQETKTNTTMTADGHLFASVQANKIYTWHLHVVYNGPTACAMKMDFTVPSGASIHGSFLCGGSGSSTQHGFAGSIQITPVTGIATSTGTDMALDMWGTLVVAGTAGTVTWRRAQDVASGTLALGIGSYLQLIRQS